MYKKATIKSEPLKTEVWLGEDKVEGLKKIKIEQEVGNEIPSIEMVCLSHSINIDFEKADVKFIFEHGWVNCEKCVPDLDEPVLALVVDKYGLHQEVLSLKHFEESDALYEGNYWCSYRTINVEALGICKVIAWQKLPPVGTYGEEDIG